MKTGVDASCELVASNKTPPPPAVESQMLHNPGEFIEPAATEVRPWKTSQDDHESQTLAALMVHNRLRWTLLFVSDVDAGFLLIFYISGSDSMRGVRGWK